MCHYRFSFDDPERRKWQNPESILNGLGLKAGHTFIDIGCGQGFFTLPAAEIVGPNGKVYALDINRQAVRTLKREASKRGITNLNAQVGAAEEITLCESCADYVFFGIDLHDFNDPQRVLANAKTMMKPTGLLVDLDWKKKQMNIGPPLERRFSQSQATKLIESTGFRVTTARTSGPNHYILTATL